MLKVRVTYIDDEKGNAELNEFIKTLEKSTTIVNQSDTYKGRGKSIYSNVYLDIEKDR